MKTALTSLALFLSFLATSSWGMALMEIEVISKERAKTLGLEVRSQAAGPELLRVEMEFPVTGEFKSFTRVDLEIHEGGKLLPTSTLKSDHSKPGRVLVGFAADRTRLDQFTLRLVTQPGTRTMVGYDLPVKAFVETAKKEAPIGSVQGYVSDVDANVQQGRSVLVATVSSGKLGSGEQTQVLATDPLLQAALMSAAERQLLVEVQYNPKAVGTSGPADASHNKVIRVRLLDQPRYQRQRALTLAPPKASRNIDGVSSTFPAKSAVEGGMLALATLEATHHFQWPKDKPLSMTDFEQARSGNHVHFVFGHPMKVEFGQNKIEITELVYSEKSGLLVLSGEKVYYATKIHHEPLDAFQKWYRAPE
ncbi:MAG: hypothetical protein ACRC8S_18175 [Fimbriiglobus sp.]